MVDTSIWIAAYRRVASAESIELRRLLNDDQVATTEVVVAELLQGARSRQDFDALAQRLDALHFFPAGRQQWIKAASLAFDMRNSGHRTALSDLVIAVVALEQDMPVYTIDEDFSRVPDLRLHRPGNPGP